MVIALLLLLLAGPLLVAAIVAGLWKWLLLVAVVTVVWEVAERIATRRKISAASARP